MSSYLNKLQEARKIAVEKYLVDNGIKYTIVKHGRTNYYVMPHDPVLFDLFWSADELITWFGIEVKVER